MKGLGPPTKQETSSKWSAMFSSSSDEWPTEDHIVEYWRARGFNFVLDAAATVESSKAPLCYTIENDALKQPWAEDVAAVDVDGFVWCNPPYSIIGGSSLGPRGEDLHGFVEKAIAECTLGLAGVVLLLPVRSCRLWFHRLLALQLSAVGDYPHSPITDDCDPDDALVDAARNAGVSAEFVFPLGRLRFGDADADAPFPSVVVVVRRGQRQ